jgi:hypothetical protein
MKMTSVALDMPPLIWLDALREQPSDIAVTIQPNGCRGEAIGLLAAPWIVAKTLDYLDGYYEPVASTPSQVMDAGFADPSVLEWAQRMRAQAIAIPGTNLVIAEGRSGDARCYVRFEDSEFADLTIFLPDRTIVLTAADGRVPPHLALARLVRNQLSSDCSLAGAAYLHAGCVTIGGRGVILLGEKFGGKTTQICELVSRGAQFTSNDRIFLFPDGRIFGLPVSVNIRAETLRRHPCLTGKGRDGFANPHRVGVSVPETEMSLSVREFADAFGGEPRSAVPLSTVVKLTRAGTEPTTARVLEPSEIATILYGGLFDGIDYSQPFWSYRKPSRSRIVALTNEQAVAGFAISVADGGISGCAELIEQLVAEKLPPPRQ